MTGKELYQMWVDALKMQGVGCDEFDELDDGDQQAWQIMGQNLRRRIKPAIEVSDMRELFVAIASNYENLTVQNYSGRNMMGKQCLAVVGTLRECQIFLADVIKYHFDEEDRDRFEDIVEDLVIFNMDTLGHNEIVMYWPNLGVPY